jgi:alpha-glucosidase (family GH31 glycosyl hydrolase)
MASLLSRAGVLWSVACVVLLTAWPYGAGAAGIERRTLATANGYLLLEVLDDNTLRIEMAGSGAAPGPEQPFPTSPMVFRSEWPGPSSFQMLAENVAETANLRIRIDPGALCATVETRNNGAPLTRVCGTNMAAPFKEVSIDRGAMTHVYGLGQQFVAHDPQADGDWLRLGVREEGEFGNSFQGFEGGALGNVHIPVMYALGPGKSGYALFFDNVYKSRWDFTANPWRGGMFGDQIRYYVFTGPDLATLRRSYMALTGTPPVPPRKAFGLWVSEFGYSHWSDIDRLLGGLRQNRFPVDGFVLDLNWFGGVRQVDVDSVMGRLAWDQDEPDVTWNNFRFEKPKEHAVAYAQDHVGLAAIEESYVVKHVPTFNELEKERFVVRRGADQHCDPAKQGDPVEVKGFWGPAAMIDWSDPLSGTEIHDRRRFPNLVGNGVTVHWTDLGEPERYDPQACYHGVAATGAGVKNEHQDIHNLYNLLWNKSIWDGYVDKQGQPNGLGVVNARPFILSRSGTAGSQRFGVAMWSGDIASTMRSLAGQANAQLHMSLSGIDYYGADVGGFRRENLPFNKDNSYRAYGGELYTQWLANAAWFDVPVRPHTDNGFNPPKPRYDTAPHLIGNLESNRANLRRRYAMIPYYYSLAYRAFLQGDAVVQPLVMAFQEDPVVREIGHEKMIGRDLLVGIVAGYGEYERNVYLPAGKWIDLESGEWFDAGSGRWVENVPEYRDGRFRLPAFVRAGAIIPQMAVHDDTLDAFGNRSSGPADPTLVVAVYASPDPTSFTLVEDDGLTLQYRPDGRPSYRYRTTELRQQRSGQAATVTIAAVQTVNGGEPSLPSTRPVVVRLTAEAARVTAVNVDGAGLPHQDSRAAFDAAPAGWLNTEDGMVLAKAAPGPVDRDRTFQFSLAPAVPAASVNFVCDRGFTQPGQSLYAVGDLPQLGGWEPAKAVRLSPSVYWDYITTPPPATDHPGPSAPVWTGVVSGLPTNTSFSWKCLLRSETDPTQATWSGAGNTTGTTGPGGFGGRTYAVFQR